MIKIHACQRNKQFMKDLEHNDFLVPKTKGLNLSPKELPIWAKLFLKKLPEDFCMNLGCKIIKEREHLHNVDVFVFIKFAYSIEDNNLDFALITVSSP